MLYKAKQDKKKHKYNNIMAVAFEDSKRALEQQLSGKVDLVHLALLVFVAILTIWAVSGKIDLYRTSVDGTLKTQGGAVVLQPEVDGTIEQAYLTVGQQVAKGQLLLQLDATEPQLTLTRLVNELEANRQQQRILADQQRLTDDKYRLLTTSLENEIAQIKAQLEQSRKILKTQKDIQHSMEQLAKTSAVARMDLLKQNLEVVRAEATTKVHQISYDDKTRQLPRNEQERELSLNRLRAELTGLKQRQVQLEKTIAQARLSVARYALYAPIDGEVVQLAPLPVGNRLSKGQKLATISDGSQWMVQTRFKAADAVGHIAAGQSARILVDGFPWRQYGSLAATVTHVAKEGLDSLVEVQLKLDQHSQSAIPLTFGLPVTVEIRTEQLSPLMLLLNAADRAARGK